MEFETCQKREPLTNGAPDQGVILTLLIPKLNRKAHEQRLAATMEFELHAQ